MSDWRNFLDEASEQAGELWRTITQEPGPVMVCFVNRYLEALDGVKCKIQYDDQTLELHTTPDRYCVTLQPKTFKPVKISVWSRMSKGYKALESIVPDVGRKKLVRKVLKTYRTEGKTERHPAHMPVAPPPHRPAPASAPGPSPTTKQGVQPSAKKDESGLPQTEVKRPVPDKITKEQLKKIFPAAKEDYLQKIADELNKDLVKFKLDTPIRRAHFFGQTRQETGPGAKGDAESFNYNADGLIKTFGYYKKKEHADEAKEDGRQEQLISGKKKKQVTRAAKEEVIANKVYGLDGNGKTLGNKDRNDGWNYRGRGLKQTTGKSNYESFSIVHKKYWDEEVDFIAHPDLVAEFPYSVRSAVAFWLKNNCWQAADGGINDAAIDAVTKIVNSGEIVNHKKGNYKKPEGDPVLNRRKYAHLAYAAFT